MAFEPYSSSPAEPTPPLEILSADLPGPPESPGPPPSSLSPELQALVRNPLVLAGGAVLVGVVLSRIFATPAARKVAGELAAEALRRIKPAAAVVGVAAARPLVEMGVEIGMERYRGQITAFGKKMLADLLVNKE